MKHYVGLKTLSGLPPFIDLVTHAYDESFREKEHLGFDYTYLGKEKMLGFLFLRWPKFKDNTDCPAYTPTCVVSMMFSPFKTIPQSKIIAARAAKLGYPFLAQVLVGSPAGVPIPAPALIDHRTFYRTVYYFAKRTGGMIFEDDRSKPLTPKDYYRRHKKIIDSPFHLKLTERDLRRYASNTF